MNKPNEIYNKEYAKKYIKTSLYPYTKIKVIRNAQIALLDNNKNKMILDVGGNINACIKHGLRGEIENIDSTAQYSVIDISSAYFDINLLKKEDSSIDYFDTSNGIVGDAHQLPYKNYSINTVILADTLEHLDDPQQVISQILRVLTTNGQLIITLPALYKLDILKSNNKLIKNKIDNSRATSHVNFFNKSKLIDLLEQNAFTINKIEGLHFVSGFKYLLWTRSEYISDLTDSNPFIQLRNKLDSIPIYILRDIDLQANMLSESFYKNLINDSTNHPLYIISKILTITEYFDQIKNTHDEINQIIDKIYNYFDNGELKNILNTVLLEGKSFLAGSFILVAEKKN